MGVIAQLGVIGGDVAQAVVLHKHEFCLRPGSANRGIAQVRVRAADQH